MRCEHEHDDGAYVLGALSAAQRAAYERHLASCSFCREAVADISALPDLLSRLDATEFARLFDPSLTKDARFVAPTVHRAGRLTRIVAAAILVLLGVGVLAWTRSCTAAPSSGSAITMTSVDGTSPITATIRMTSTTGGTRVTVVCAYREAASGPYTFRLIAYGPGEEPEQIGSWPAAPGVSFPMEGGVTHFAPGSLARLELIRYDGRAVLAYDVR